MHPNSPAPMHPTVSVVMAVYNGQRYLREAVESVLNQTFTDLEFVIVDDASTDDTPEILRIYAQEDSRIRLVRNDRNLGLTRSLNEGFRTASGEFLARQDADDVSLRDRLALQVQFLSGHTQVGVVGAWVAYIDEQGKQMGIWQTPTSPAHVRWSLLFGPALAHPSILMRKSLVEESSPYRAEIRYAQDYDLWVRLSERTQLANLPALLYLRRVHEDMVGRKYSWQQEETVRAIMQEKITKLLGKPVSETVVTGLRSAIRGEPLETDVALRMVADLIEILYRTYILRNQLSTAERKTIRKDSAQRLAQIAVRHVDRWPFDSTRIMLKALCLRRDIMIALYFRRMIVGFLKAMGRRVR